MVRGPVRPDSVSVRTAFTSHPNALFHLRALDRIASMRSSSDDVNRPHRWRFHRCGKRFGGSVSRAAFTSRPMPQLHLRASDRIEFDPSFLRRFCERLSSESPTYTRASNQSLGGPGFGRVCCRHPGEYPPGAVTVRREPTRTANAFDSMGSIALSASNKRRFVSGSHGKK